MIRTEVEIPNQLGLHARAAAKFVQAASRWKATVELARENQVVNGKSILGILLLAAGKGSRLALIVDGPDETDATEHLAALIRDGFGELAESG